MVADMNTQPAPLSWVRLPEGGHVGYQIDPELVRDFMLRAGVTQAMLADRLGTSRGYVHDILSGRRQPREDKVKALADALDVHPRALLLRAVSAPQNAATPDESAVPA